MKIHIDIHPTKVGVTIYFVDSGPVEGAWVRSAKELHLMRMLTRMNESIYREPYFREKRIMVADEKTFALILLSGYEQCDI